MNVKQLIDELSKLPPETHVLVFNSETYFHEELEEISYGEGCNAVVLEKC